MSPLSGKVRTIEIVSEFVSDGSSLFLGGFTLHKVPMGLAREVARLGRRDLTVWSHIGGAGVEQLLAVNAVRHVRSSYVGLDILGFAPLFQAQVASGQVQYTEETEATLMFGMKARQYRIPFMPSRALVGSAIVDDRDDLTEYDCQLSGERLVALPPVHADVALLHAQRADEQGNTVLIGSMGNDIEIAKVCDRVIVSVEEVVTSAELLEAPEQVRLPGHLVDAVVHLPYGAHPTSCLPYYSAAYDVFLDYLEAVDDDRVDSFVETAIAVTQQAYLDQYVRTGVV